MTEDVFADIVDVLKLAYRVYGSYEMAFEFMRRPHQLLHGKTPIESIEEGDYEKVKQILLRLQHGSVS